MEDRELLELAAKAVGYQPWGSDCEGYPIFVVDSMPIGWNPLTDDGDALRLAVELGVKLRWHPVLRQALAWIPIDIEIRVGIEECSSAGSATRRAIVLAAAEIGKAMQEKH